MSLYSGGDVTGGPGYRHDFDAALNEDPPPIPFVPANPKECTCVDPWSNCPTHG